MSDNIKSMKSLRERAREFDARLPFMEGRDKGETAELLGMVNTINEYGFLNDENGEPYAVFTVAERSKKFYFGGEVITERLLTLEAEGYHEAINTEGLPVLMTKKKSKIGGRQYTSVEFFPEQ